LEVGSSLTVRNPVSRIKDDARSWTFEVSREIQMGRNKGIGKRTVNNLLDPVAPSLDDTHSPGFQFRRPRKVSQTEGLPKPHPHFGSDLRGLFRGGCMIDPFKTVFSPRLQIVQDGVSQAAGIRRTER
jgi:hypothetical protein